ncbi:MAG TPA: OB-fold nucleic acid binding domain-containing protein [Candidatus Nanopelagicaceae bacterium]
MLVDSVDIATVGAVRYARSLNPQSLTAVHFVIDDLRAKTISAEWAKNKGLSDVPLELVDCPDRRLPNAAVDYAIRAIAGSDVELTLLLPRRSYSFFLGRILHDRTAEAIAAPISQLPGVVATIVPFDVEKIISGNLVTRPAETKTESPVKITESKKYTAKRDVMVSMPGPVSHYSEKMLPIGNVTWRERAHVRGRVTSIMSAPSGSAPGVDIEIWDETGGITLHFLGRRSIAGLNVGSTITAEGMVGESGGNLTIMNPSYEILL